MDESRFDRLEQKIDKLTDAVTKIVRVEEQLISNNKRVDRLELRMDKTEDDVDSLADIIRTNQNVSKFAERLFWIVVTAAVSALFWFMR
jgi:predicted RNase H-like nuclease (RuvC/YqgF family)